MPSTGDALLADSGELSYNTVVFSVLYQSQIKGECVPDDAGRTFKFFKGTLSAEGIVSVADGIPLTENFPVLQSLLTQQGGTLTYKGRGFGELIVNAAGGSPVDVAWGPIPRLLHFQPLGNGLSAHVRWECDFNIYNQQLVGVRFQPLQFSYGIAISFDDECYSTVSFKGVLEVPITRAGGVNGRAIIPPTVADAYRQNWLNMAVDLTLYRVNRRVFDESPDKRKIAWEYAIEELPPMNLPPGATKARGVMDIQPIRSGGQKSMLLLGCIWSCNLKVTYTIRKDFPRATASVQFWQLLLYRMLNSQFGAFAGTGTNAAGAQNPVVVASARNFNILDPLAATRNVRFEAPAVTTTSGDRRGEALLSHFGVSEGLYLDSKTVTFEASWVLLTSFKTLLLASGIWRWPVTQNAGNAAGNVTTISGWRSWLANSINPAADAIVDFSGGTPPLAARPIARQ